MLELFRRYQKFLYLVITVVIVLSFSLFGTYNTFATKETKDTVAFTAADGSKVYRSELNDLISLISSGQRELIFGIEPERGNGFNDGVISKNILESGIGEVIVAPYLKKMSEEFRTRLEKEKSYTPYIHPRAPFISAEQIWAYFAPDLKQNFDSLRLQTDPTLLETFSIRVQLFLAERRFPSGYLKQLLKYQEGEHSWLHADEELPYRDLSLFGYHSLEEWFGKDFIQLVAEYIINTAKIAESKGYTVSQDEVLQSLFQNLEASFRESRRNPYFGYNTLESYFQGELRRLGLDQARLVQAWGNVLLFRKIFNENKDAVLVSDLAYKDFYKHMNEYADVGVYKLPQEFVFQNASHLQKFQIYIRALRGSKDEKVKTDRLIFPPKNILSAEELRKVFPELVVKSYRLRHASLNKEMLELKIGVKSTWEWEIADANWKTLQSEFPDLALQKAVTQEERLNLLDRLDAKTRALVDGYSRNQILNEHPDWIVKALDEAPLKDEVVVLKEGGSKSPFEGVQNCSELIGYLDAASLNVLSPNLSAYSQDRTHYHRIIVYEKPVGFEILTFREALNDGTLNEILDKILEGAYPRVRSQKTGAFIKENGEWKPLSEVKDLVAELYFEEFYKQLDREIEREKVAMPHFCNWDDKEAARLACRLLPYMKEAAKSIQESPGSSSQWIQDPKSSSLTDQWKLLYTPEKVVRLNKKYSIDPTDAFSLNVGDSSKVSYFGKTGLCFFKVLDKGFLPTDELIHNKVMEVRNFLGKSVELDLALLLLAQMQKSGSLKLDESAAHAK